MQRRQLERGEADPVCERRAVDPDALARQHLRLAIQGKVIGVLRHDHVGDERLGRQPARDEAGRRRDTYGDIYAKSALTS